MVAGCGAAWGGQRMELGQEEFIRVRTALLDAAEAELARPRGQIRFTGIETCDALLNDLEHTPQAFVFACLVDRQVPAERAWALPSLVLERSGSLAIEDLMGLDELEWVQVLRDPTPAHRFPEKMATVLHQATARIAKSYAGDAARIWSDGPSSARLVRRFLEFHGAGPKIATMAANILARDFRIDLKDRRFIDISADVQVVRVMSRLGLVRPGAGVSEVVYAARDLHPDYPGIFDLTMWRLGRDVCRPRDPRCRECPLQSVCGYPIGRSFSKMPPSSSRSSPSTRAAI